MGKFTDRLRTKSNMIRMGEKIAFGSECELMDQSADIIDELAEALIDNLDRFTGAFPASRDYPPIKAGYAALAKLESLSNE